jgi:hypothetical protein
MSKERIKPDLAKSVQGYVMQDVWLRICGLGLAAFIVTNLVISIRPFFKFTFDDIITIPCFMLLLGEGVMLVASGTRCRIA